MHTITLSAQELYKEILEHLCQGLQEYIANGERVNKCVLRRWNSALVLAEILDEHSDYTNESMLQYVIDSPLGRICKKARIKDITEEQ